MIQLYINSSIKGCVDYEQMLLNIENIVLVEKYSIKHIIESVFVKKVHIFQFKLKYAPFYALIFWGRKNHYIDFRTLSVNENKIVRFITNWVIKYYLRYFNNTIADPTAYNYFSIPNKYIYGLGTFATRSTLRFNASDIIRVVYIGSINRKNFHKICDLVKSTSKYNIQLDVFCGESPSPRLKYILDKSFNKVSYFEWVGYEELPSILKSYDLGISYTDPDVYSSQVPLKILDYASAGLFTLTNITDAIEKYIPQHIYITNIDQIVSIKVRIEEFNPPFNDWNTQVEDLIYRIQSNLLAQ